MSLLQNESSEKNVKENPGIGLRVPNFYSANLQRISNSFFTKQANTEGHSRALNIYDD